MRKALFLLSLLCFVLFFTYGTTYAADATATVTVNYTTPLTVEEVNPFTFSFTKKPGVSGTNVTISNLQQELYGTKQYFNGVTYQMGCIKITGDPGKRVYLRITPSNTLTGSKGTTITLTVPSNRVVGATVSSCGQNVSSLYDSTVNGVGAITLDGAGFKYVKWWIGGTTSTSLFYLIQATFSTIQPDTFTAPVTYEVWYE